MYKKTIVCPYASTEIRTQKLANLKEKYAVARSKNIRKLLKVSENFVLFGCGSADDITRLISQVESPTDEEKMFFLDLKEVLN